MSVNWTSLLGIDSLLSSCRQSLSETALAAEDRAELAQLEWQEHKSSIKTLVVLAIALGALTVVMLIVLSIALMIQFWDTSYRTAVAWCLAGGWVLVWALCLWRALSAANQLSNPFKLTRHELKTDWKALKEKI